MHTAGTPNALGYDTCLPATSKLVCLFSDDEGDDREQGSEGTRHYNDESELEDGEIIDFSPTLARGTGHGVACPNAAKPTATTPWWTTTIASQEPPSAANGAQAVSVPEGDIDLHGELENEQVGTLMLGTAGDLSSELDREPRTTPTAARAGAAPPGPGPPATEGGGQPGEEEIDTLLNKFLPVESQLEAVVQQSQITELQAELESLRGEHAKCPVRLSKAVAETARWEAEAARLKAEAEANVGAEPPGRAFKGSAVAAASDWGDQGALLGPEKWEMLAVESRKALVRGRKRHAEEVHALREQLEAERVRHEKVRVALQADVDRGRRRRTGSGWVGVTASNNDNDGQTQKLRATLEGERELHRRYQERMDARVAYLEMQAQLTAESHRAASGGEAQRLAPAGSCTNERRDSGSSTGTDPEFFAPRLEASSQPLLSSIEIFVCRWAHCQMAFPSREGLKRHVAAHFSD